jgi:hypothetical protein
VVLGNCDRTTRDDDKTQGDAAAAILAPTQKLRGRPAPLARPPLLPPCGAAGGRQREGGWRRGLLFYSSTSSHSHIEARCKGGSTANPGRLVHSQPPAPAFLFRWTAPRRLGRFHKGEAGHFCFSVKMVEGEEDTVVEPGASCGAFPRPLSFPCLFPSMGARPGLRPLGTCFSFVDVLARPTYTPHTVSPPVLFRERAGVFLLARET